MKSVLITGCNRGIGLGLVQQLLKQPKPPEHIIATCRNIEKAATLNEIAAKNNNVHVLEIDVTHFNKYPEFINKIEKIVGDNGVNLLFNNAGISTKFSRISLVKVEQLTENFVVNTVAPIMLAKACLPLLKKASLKNEHLPIGVSRAAIVNISSILGSVEKNHDGGFYPYRCSKSALNIASKSLSLDLKNDKIFVISIHPGWCKTDLGGKNAPLEVDDTVYKMVETLKTLKSEHNGGFIQYNGEVLPW